MSETQTVETLPDHPPLDVRTQDFRRFEYPNFSQRDWGFPDQANNPWRASLNESDRGEDGLYRKDGFDIQTAMDAIDAPVLEIGGPSYNFGYVTLDDKKMPSKPFNMNIEGSWRGLEGSDSVGVDDYKKIDALADSRAMPVADESVGMVLVAHMTKMDQTAVRSIPDHAKKREMIINIYADALGAIALGQTDALKQTDSPRIGAIIEAARVLKQDGLFVLRGLAPEDVAIAESQGLELVMHTPRMADTPDGTGGEITEAVFRKTAKH